MPCTEAEIRHAITGLLENREPPATICPSEAARALAPDDWRAPMSRVGEAAVAMAMEGFWRSGKAARLSPRIGRYENLFDSQRTDVMEFKNTGSQDKNRTD